MRPVRPWLPLALATVALAGCGGSSHSRATSTPPGATTTGSSGSGHAPSFAAARTATTAAGSVEFTLTIKARVGGGTVEAEESGTVSFNGRRAHLYKQIPGSTVPEELVLIGPFTYTNANVQAALADPTVKPWTKLDTRRLTAKQRRAEPDELAHVVAPAYLADGVAVAKRAGNGPSGTTRFTGVVDPARLARTLPASLRASITTAVRNDYAAKPFPTTFWLDSRGRIRRVLVDYKTPQGTRITVDTSYSNFGTKIDVTLPAAGDIKDITP
jgi:hypothetical protein